MSASVVSEHSGSCFRSASTRMSFTTGLDCGVLFVAWQTNASVGKLSFTGPMVVSSGPLADIGEAEGERD